jgi:HD-GYP domain-containing protein (c-di-GMP phosphodiesterase class II)
MDIPSITLEAYRLRLGLFVTALDRPWVGTKFLFQGFLIETDEELAALQNTCSWVVIDLSRSHPEAAHGLHTPAASPKEAHARGRQARSQQAASDGLSSVVPGPLVTSTAKTQQARSKRARRLLDRTARHYYTPLPVDERPPEIPMWEPLVKYAEDPGSLRPNLTRASTVAKAARGSLARLAREIVDKGELQLHEIESTASDLTESIVENPSALAWLVRARKNDASTYLHNVTVAVYLLTLGRHLGYPPPRLVKFATIGLLLDIGKLFVDRALLSRTGPLTAVELGEVQKHVELGLAALTPSGELDQAIVDGIAQHHEWIDGSGYPNGLKGDAISMEGRLAAIADSFTAMTSPRTYAPPLTAYQAMRELYRQAGTHYQESLVDKFVQAVGIFPVGAMVELSGGEIAVVVRHNQHRRLEPCVLVLTDGNRNRLNSPLEIDLLTQAQLSVEHKLTRIARAVPPGELDLDVSGLYLG